MRNWHFCRTEAAYIVVFASIFCTCGFDRIAGPYVNVYPPSILTSSIPDATVGIPYSFQIEVNDPDKNEKLSFGLSRRIAGKIAFGMADDNIHIMDEDGTNIRRVTSNPASDLLARISPNGLQIVFYSNTVSFSNFAGTWEIYVIDIDGSNQTRLTFNDVSDANPAWSPDGTKIVFNSTRNGRSDMYIMDADGSNLVRLQTNPEDEDGLPHWSLDGTKIVFWSERDGNREIYVINPDGTGQTRLTDTPKDENWPKFSPDGSKILFYYDVTVINADGLEAPRNRDIFVMNSDGTNRINLTNHPANDVRGSWSPDGTKIVFESNRSIAGDQLAYVMDADGSNVIRLVKDDPPGMANLHWSPVINDLRWLSINDTGLLVGTPGPDDVGENIEISITVIDRGGFIARLETTITVNPG